MDRELMKTRARLYQFLSTLYRDEIPVELLAAMQNPEFQEGLNEAVTGCGFIDLMSGAKRMTEFLQIGPPEVLYQQLRFDYAELIMASSAI